MVVSEILTYNATKRAILSVVMLSLYSFIIQHNYTTIILIFTIKYVSISEILFKQKKVSKLFIFLSYYFLICFDIPLLKILNIKGLDLKFLAFLFYTLGLIVFIVSLTKKTLKHKFKSFALIHLSIFILSFPVNQMIYLILENKVWFFYSTLLVIVNDVFAYLVGRKFGKTSLYELSPKKTVEGYLGAYFFTVIFSYGFVFYFKEDLGCYKEYLKVFDYLFLRKLYVHAFLMASFASIVAPFGGFFASAYKRMIKIKDFSSYIPGHGGMLDRMDCQFLMGMFTNLYLKSFIKKNFLMNDKVKMMIKYNKSEVIELCRLLIDGVLNE